MLCYDAAYIAKPFKSSLLMDRCIHCNFLFMGEIQLDENFNVVIHFNAYQFEITLCTYPMNFNDCTEDYRLHLKCPVFQMDTMLLVLPDLISEVKSSILSVTAVAYSPIPCPTHPKNHVHNLISLSRVRVEQSRAL